MLALAVRCRGHAYSAADAWRAGRRFSWPMPSSANGYPDRSNEPGQTRAELLARLQPGDALTFMAVLIGMGPAFSVDHNDSAVFDGDEAPLRS